MQQYRKNLGKVSLTSEGAWSRETSYEILSIVYDEHTQRGFISRQNVPQGIDLYNKEYWMPFNVSGYADNNMIILADKVNEHSIKSYTLEEAILSIAQVGRRPGTILGFYNENVDRLDIGGRWELWQFNDTNIYNWENVTSWQSLYYNYNKFVGWFENEDFLIASVMYPEIGCYAFVGSALNEATIYRCDSKHVWHDTTQHAWDYVKINVGGNVTIGENGNWFNNGVDTKIPATIKGENGKTPLIRNNNNVLEYSYDNKTWTPISDKIAAWFRLKDNKIQISQEQGVWTDVSDYIAAWFRWQATAADAQANNIGRLQISRDGKNWETLSPDISNNLHISRYIAADASLPTTGIAEGTIYAKGPTYAEDDANHDYPKYRLWVYAWKDDTLAWQDNGEFTGIAAGVVQETGNSETEVMSQKAVTEKLSELGSEVENKYKELDSKSKDKYNREIDSDEIEIINSKGDTILKINDDNISVNGVDIRRQYSECNREINSKRELIIESDNGDLLGSIDDKGFHLNKVFPSKGNKTNLIYPFEGKTLCTIGDSILAGETIAKNISLKTGCKYGSENNFSVGGTLTYGNLKDCGLVRTFNLVNSNIIPDIVLLECINDNPPSDEADIKAINPFHLSNILKGYSKADWDSNRTALLGSVPESDRGYGVAIELLSKSSGKNLKFLNTPLSDGDIYLTVTYNGGSQKVGIHVTTKDTIDTLYAKVLEYSYTRVVDTLSADGGVNFAEIEYTDKVNVTVDVQSTGLSYSVTDTDNADKSTLIFFVGDSLSDWTDSSKWSQYLPFYEAWKGLIEMLQNKFPKAMVVMLVFPKHNYYLNDYKKTDGFYDWDRIVNGDTYKNIEKRIEANIKLAKYYNIPYIDLHHNCGINIHNYGEYYPNNNVHPNSEGYNYLSNIISNELLNLNR